MTPLLTLWSHINAKRKVYVQYVIILIFHAFSGYIPSMSITLSHSEASLGVEMKTKAKREVGMRSY